MQTIYYLERVGQFIHNSAFSGVWAANYGYDRKFIYWSRSLQCEHGNKYSVKYGRMDNMTLLRLFLPHERQIRLLSLTFSLEAYLNLNQIPL